MVSFFNRRTQKGLFLNPCGFIFCSFVVYKYPLSFDHVYEAHPERPADCFVLQIVDCGFKDVGEYLCVASNEAGSTSCKAIIGVKGNNKVNSCTGHSVF